MRMTERYTYFCNTLIYVDISANQVLYPKDIPIFYREFVIFDSPHK